jgi:hypothetical protein
MRDDALLDTKPVLPGLGCLERARGCLGYLIAAWIIARERAPVPRK